MNRSPEYAINRHPSRVVIASQLPSSLSTRVAELTVAGVAMTGSPDEAMPVAGVAIKINATTNSPNLSVRYFMGEHPFTVGTW
jgi:hypothetical protein